ncbi:threonine/serine exporter family protein [Mycobacterium sp. URHB0021]
MAVLPGLALTIAAMELASGQMISGATRLIYGVAQLGLLVFGVGLGLHVGAQLTPQQPSAQMGGWSLYVAVIRLRHDQHPAQPLIGQNQSDERLTHLPTHRLEGRRPIPLDVCIGDRLGDPLVG